MDLEIPNSIPRLKYLNRFDALSLALLPESFPLVAFC